MNLFGFMDRLKAGKERRTMIKSELANYIYQHFFAGLYNGNDEMLGKALAANVVIALTKDIPISIAPVYKGDGSVWMSATKTTDICRDLGIERFILDVQEKLANIKMHPTVDKIVSEKTVLMTNQEDIKLLLAVAVCFYDTSLLHIAIADPVNGRVMRSEDTFKYLHRCFLLFV